MEDRQQRLRKRLIAAAREDLQKKDFDAAIRRFVRLSGLEPSNPAYPLKRGELEHRRGRASAAAEAFASAAKLFAKEAFDDKAASLYKRALQCAPERVDLVSELAMSYARSGRIGEAIHLLGSRAAESAAAGRIDEAINLQQALVRLEPSATSARLRLAEQLEQADREEEALHEYVESAISLAEGIDPDGVVRVAGRIQDLMEKATTLDSGELGRLFHGVARAYSLAGGSE